MMSAAESILNKTSAQLLIADITALQDYYSDETKQSKMLTFSCDKFKSICSLFGLDAYEQRVLLLAIGNELGYFFTTKDTTKIEYGTISWAMSLDIRSHWGAWHPSSPLWRWLLLKNERESLRPESFFRVDLPILYHLIDLEYTDNYLDCLRSLTNRELLLSNRQQKIVQQGKYLLLQNSTDNICVSLCGKDNATAMQVAKDILHSLSLIPSFVKSNQIPRNVFERNKFIRLMERELLIHNRVPVFCQKDIKSLKDIELAIDDFSGPTLLIGERQDLSLEKDFVYLKIPMPDANERSHLWGESIGSRVELLPEDKNRIEQLAYHFPLSNSVISKISLIAEGNSSTSIIDSCWDEIRLRCRPTSSLLELVECKGTWQDLVLPQAQINVLKAICSQVKHRSTVYQKWDFANKSSRGLAITALFCGASGAGKTFSAEVLANELSLDLYRVDLAQTVDKYVGETEKHLDRVFEDGARAGAILLFDEADALFSQRGDVKSGQDRFANMTVGYLLQRMETYPGLAILCTNLKSHLDKAFMRRIRFAVHFPFPSQQERKLIWKKSFPSKTPLNNIDWDSLSRISLNGGDVRTIALNAAFIAANEKSDINMQHIASAVEIEAGKNNRQSNAAEVRRLVKK